MYCSTVQGLLDWFEVDLGFTELSFIQIDLCVLCVSVLYSRVSLSSCPFLDILHCLPRAVGVPLESALNLVNRMSPSVARATEWRRLVGCLKLQVIFRKRVNNYRALLRKMTCKDKASYDSTLPCTQFGLTLARS